MLLGEINDRLYNLESQFADQMNVIKTMILNIEDKLSQHESQMRHNNGAIFNAIVDLKELTAICYQPRTGKFHMIENFDR